MFSTPPVSPSQKNPNDEIWELLDNAESHQNFHYRDAKPSDFPGHEYLANNNVSEGERAAYFARRAIALAPQESLCIEALIDAYFEHEIKPHPDDFDGGIIPATSDARIAFLYRKCLRLNESYLGNDCFEFDVNYRAFIARCILNKEITALPEDFADKIVPDTVEEQALKIFRCCPEEEITLHGLAKLIFTTRRSIPAEDFQKNKKLTAILSSASSPEEQASQLCDLCLDDFNECDASTTAQLLVLKLAITISILEQQAKDPAKTFPLHTLNLQRHDLVFKVLTYTESVRASHMKALIDMARLISQTRVNILFDKLPAAFKNSLMGSCNGTGINQRVARLICEAVLTFKPDHEEALALLPEVTPSLEQIGNLLTKGFPGFKKEMMRFFARPYQASEPVKKVAESKHCKHH